MSNTTVAFYGIRLDVGDDDIELLEDRSHPAIVRARAAGLQYYWGNFGSPGERYLLFVGRALGKLGAEDSSELVVSAAELVNIASDVSTRLSQSGFTESPMFFVQFQPD